jgi:predicted flap endonuclease-1-like 5' DNA nuclease/uncharacterized membrane protein
MVVEQAEQTFAAFVLDKGSQAKSLLESIEKIDEIDTNVQIVDAAIVDRTKRGRIKIHQTTDRGALKSGARGGTLGVIVGALVLGPAGAVVGGAAGTVLGGLRGKIHDTGINDKFMKEVAAEIEKGKSALFVQYEGNWSGSLGVVEQAIKDHNAMLFHSSLPADKARTLQMLVVPAIEELGGEEAVADYEVEVEETVTADEAAAAEAADTVVAEAPAPEAPVEEAPAPVAAAAAGVAVGPGPADDLTQLAGIGPKSAAALTAAGISTYQALSEANEPQIRRALYASDMLPPANVSSWPGQAEYAAKGDWVGLMKRNQKTSAAKPAAAAAAPAAPAAAPDDLTQISGIGPRLASILSRGGVTTYSQLEQMSPDELKEIIALGGALPPASLSSWPAQASYAVRGDFSGLASYNRSR